VVTRASQLCLGMSVARIAKHPNPRLRAKVCLFSRTAFLGSHHDCTARSFLGVLLSASSATAYYSYDVDCLYRLLFHVPDCVKSTFSGISREYITVSSALRMGTIRKRLDSCHDALSLGTDEGSCSSGTMKCFGWLQRAYKPTFG
jgi:hypothetical protein